MKTMKSAIYAGSFDPFTLGHEDVLLQSVGLFDHVTILVCHNPLKSSFISPANRERIIRLYLHEKGLQSVDVAILPEQMSTVDFAKSAGIGFLIRGIRTVTDFEYEMQIAAMNRILGDPVTVYFTPSTANQFTSSSMAREFYRLRKDLSALVPGAILRELKK